MPTFRVYEKQVIVYSWLVQADSLEQAAEEGPVPGVPDGAITEKFHSDNFAEPVDSRAPGENVYNLNGRIVDEDEDETEDVPA